MNLTLGLHLIKSQDSEGKRVKNFCINAQGWILVVDSRERVLKSSWKASSSFPKIQGLSISPCILSIYDLNFPTQIRQVSSSATHLLLLDSANAIHTMTTSDAEKGLNVFSKLEPGAPCLDVVAGPSFSFAVLQNGGLLAWGCNDCGQLGLPASTKQQENPKLVPGLPGIVQATAGEKHSACLDQHGRVWTFGCGLHGQLGHGDASFSEPRLVDLFAHGIGHMRSNGTFEGCKKVAAGRAHTAVLTSTGEVYTFGENKYAQLGRPGSAYLPKALGLEDIFVDVAAGSRHTGFVSQDGSLFVCGALPWDDASCEGTFSVNFQQQPVQKHDDTFAFFPHPTRVRISQAQEEVPVRAVRCGGWNCVAQVEF